VSIFALVLATYIVPGIEVTGLYPAIMSAFFLGLCNALIRPLLVVLTLPITILTLGIFIFVINAGIFLFVASFVDGFRVDGFLPALFGSILVSIISGVVNMIVD
jgi:putative membrane protein